ncbi:hypothetical protein [Flavobacterium sp.]|uniref:hypothetical protein n=1 Tax=Flavobacterium sp. TaxID=239 RepID=UPI00404788FE
MNLENLNLVELNAQEVLEIEGGALPGWLKKIGWGYLASVVTENWSDIKAGAIAGWNETNPNN